MRIVTRVAALAITAALAGCTSLKPAANDPAARLSAEAQTRLRAGDFSGAGQLYEKAGGISNVPDYFRLRAADAYLRAGDSATSRRVLGSVDPRRLDADDHILYGLLNARIDLNAGRAREAMAKLDSLDYSQMTLAQKGHYHTLRASAYNQLGNMVESARERIAAGPLLSSPEAVQKNNEAIFDALSRVPDPVLEQQSEAATGVFEGWVALARAVRQTTPDQRAQAIAEWNARYPSHPARGAFADSLMRRSDRAAAEPPTTAMPAAETSATVQITPLAEPGGSRSAPVVAVLLPLSGTYAAPAQAIRTGIDAAHDADTAQNKPALRFYDTQAGDVPALYRKALAEGATQVIGPLLKEDVAALANIGDMATPVLALNENPGVSADRLFQFGLTPEQEVEQVAASARMDNRHTALMIAPSSAYGQRVANHFSDYWRQTGGRIAAAKTYTAGGNDYSTLLEDVALLVGQGGQTTPVPYENVADFIFLAADEHDGRIIKPYLESLGVDLPVYAMSSLYSGEPDPGLGRELNGVVFCDIPWLLDETAGDALSERALEAKVVQTPQDYRRLIAMGIDAYRLAGRLDELHSGGRFEGATGILTVGEGNRIHRQLSCARFEGNSPRLIGRAPSL
ncbi:putative lipoprotein [Methylococcus capsulatus str. Bath]|uniref:Putative lipoprotein n=1 Tax=Methylococcus capsulatus (strain ATCC 33009 / NCIMB 11132 / Bath) TaxID=243233 RepID=Q60CC3_METCA|nr:penicillin-binding protein activator [Methylococcus capsulatus]AAU90705.1 putative lipoprotein [Methylococcus capsulatus str. Bath]